jgi:hypothetical protein
MSPYPTLPEVTAPRGVVIDTGVKPYGGGTNDRNAYQYAGNLCTLAGPGLMAELSNGRGR